MAFNPFTSFRRYQKAIFATMAIVCMVLFVLSSGVGGTDLLHQFSEWFSRGRAGKEDAAASIDGKKIGQDVVGMTMQQRKMANAYMESVTELAVHQVFDSVNRQKDKASPELQQIINGFGTIQTFKRQFRLPAEYLLSDLMQLHRQVRQARIGLTISNPANKDEQTRLADTMQTLLEREIYRLNRAVYLPRDGYFDGRLDNTEDTLDFLLWKKQADRLGVRMLKPDVDELIAGETMHQKLSPDVLRSLDVSLRQNFRGYSLDALNSALIDEFRVRSAKHALMGSPQAMAATASTPDEMFEWYQDARTTLRAGLIEIPVAKFVDKVTETPTEAQLRDLYNKHKNDEYDPRFERPGFKEPRKVKIEWIELPNDAPFYSKAAELAPVFSAIAQFGTPSLAGDGTPAFGWSAVLTARQAMGELPAEHLFREYQQNEPSWGSPFALGLRSGVHDSSVLRPEIIANFVATAVANGATQAGPFAAPMAMESAVIARENLDRARIGATAILAGAMDPAPLGIDALVMANTPKGPTEAAVSSILAQRQRERMVKGLLESDRDRFVNELGERNKKQDRNNVEAFINEFAHSRQLRRGGTADVVDRFALPDDPGLAEVRAAFTKTPQGKDPTGESFASSLVDSRTQEKPPLFQIQQLTSNPVSYLYWRSEDRDPRAITFEQARPKVEAAWRFEKARPLAKAEAERLAAEAKNKTEMELRDLAAKVSSRGLIELAPMARLNPSQAFAAGGSPRYDGPVIPPEKVKYSGDLVNTVINLRKDNAGSTAVGQDFAKSNYFVAALISKEVPTADAFRIAYKGSMGPPNFRDNLFDHFRNERADKYRTELTKQLRSDAKLEIYKPEKKSDDEGG